MAQNFKLRAQFPDHTISFLRVDNAAEFHSHVFNEFCESYGISVEYSVSYIHQQNGLAENTIKRVQWIARTILLSSKLPTTAWGHAVIHAGQLIRYRPTSNNEYSPHQLLTSFPPNVSHLRVFGCAVFVPIPPSQRDKMGPQRQLGIYVGFDSTSIIRYLNPNTGDLFRGRLADCHFDETVFPSLGGDSIERRELKFTGQESTMNDVATADTEVKKLIHLHTVAQLAPDAFNDTRDMLRSTSKPILNIPSRTLPTATQTKKRGRPSSLKHQPTQTTGNDRETSTLEVPSSNKIRLIPFDSDDDDDGDSPDPSTEGREELPLASHASISCQHKDSRPSLT